MENRKLFLIRFNQLRECLESQNEENMLLLSQVIRQLLVDGSRLLDIVNRDPKLPITFRVGMSSREREEEMSSLGLPSPSVHFLGAFPPNEIKRDIKLKSFLKFPMANYKGQHFSVKSLVKTCANRLGGVHIGESASDSEEESEIRKFGEVLQQMGMHHAFASLIVIANVTYDALEPLAETLTTSNVKD